MANDPKASPRAAIALGAAAAVAGAASLFFRRSSKERYTIESDAPNWTKDSAGDGERPVVGTSVLIARPKQELYDVWSRFERFPEFMENVESVSVEGDVSSWQITAPAGQEVKLKNRITRRVPGEEISWQSEPDSDIINAGKVRFSDAPAGRGTYVSLVLSYEPPAGAIGRGIAKLLQREPAIQARRDLRRFKQLMETGEVTTNASPSGRASDSPTEPRI
ncbi:SRPBCC family protein [Sphingomonas mesophila]|uniref:SRPBCC family protein n=1 Tax=Sphingomonas mesophila TaxID=2303576 RepID=UPI001F07E0F6|nr:SRPBCC family protein [Sphingomonas mesophila]